MKREAKWNTIFNQYLREKRLYCYYEIKMVKGKTFYFSQIEPHQWDGLQAVEKEGFIWKLSDQDQRLKPMDGFCTPPLPSYLVLKWPDCFHLIPFGLIVGSGKKSLKLAESEELAQIVIHI